MGEMHEIDAAVEVAREQLRPADSDMVMVPRETLRRVASVLADPAAEHPHDQSYLQEEIAALSASPVGEGDAPVAWRVEYRMPNGRIAGVQYCGNTAAVAFAQDTAKQRTTVTPLYDRPAPATPEGLREIIADVRALCNGHPHAKIAWPHRELHAIADRLAALQPQAQEGEEPIAAALAFARLHEAWEADLIRCGAAWREGHPFQTDELYDSFTEVQTARNRFLAALQPQAEGE